MFTYYEYVGGETMARNKYPEQTVERILDVSTRLFLEKGYDNTSLQDIINELGNLTKGAIYHHFRSKEDIFDALASKLGESNRLIFNKILNENSLNGAEKLKKIVSTNVENLTTQKLINATPNLLDNPKFLAIQIREIQDVVTPEFIAPIIEMGVADGSIKTDKPYEVAEAITLMINIWINPVILGTDYERTPNKCIVINEFTAKYGFELFDDNTIKKVAQFAKK